MRGFGKGAKSWIIFALPRTFLKILAELYEERLISLFHGIRMNEIIQMVPKWFQNIVTVL